MMWNSSLSFKLVGTVILLADVTGRKRDDGHTAERLTELFKRQQASTLCFVAIVVLPAEPRPKKDTLQLSIVSKSRSRLLRVHCTASCICRDHIWLNL